MSQVKQEMNTLEKMVEKISLLNDDDKQKVFELIDILLRQNKYNKLRTEIEARREEIKRGDVLSHDEIWKDRNI